MKEVEIITSELVTIFDSKKSFLGDYMINPKFLSNMVPER